MAGYSRDGRALGFPGFDGFLERAAGGGAVFALMCAKRLVDPTAFVALPQPFAALLGKRIGARLLNVRAKSMRAASAVLLVAALPGVAQATEELNLVPDMPIMVGLLIAFLLLVYPLNALLFKPIFAVLEERNERIAGARRRADQLEGEANKVINRYRAAVDEVRDEAEQARRAQLESARSQQVDITSAARDAAEVEVARARGEIRAAVDDARSSLRNEVESLARQAAERIAGRELS